LDTKIHRSPELDAHPSHKYLYYQVMSAGFLNNLRCISK